MQRNTVIILLCLIHVIASGQCTYLAYDGFNYGLNLPLNGAAGGTGWQNPWNVQNNDASVPGYQSSASAASLSYSNLQALGNHATGGRQYLTAGRRLNSSSNGPFAAYVQSGSDYIGSLYGDTLWMSAVISKLTNDNQEVGLDLHNDNIPWCNNCSSQHIGIGYFGSNSDVGGQRRWTLRVGNNYYTSSELVSINTPTFLALRIIFVNGSTEINFYVNPVLGNAGPGSPAVSHTASSSITFRSIAAYLGDIDNRGAMDELRFATSYPCVAPDPSVQVNLPPTAMITASPSSGQRPLNVSLSGIMSSDPEGGNLTYLWNFGDGTPNATTPTVSHTYNALGQLAASLTVTDALGLQHTSYHTITVLDENNTFPCQTTVAVLNMASCNAADGRIRINVNDASIELRNASNAIQAITNGSEYHNLAAGNYRLTVDGNNSVCTDTFNLYVRTDSTTCNGWLPSTCAMDIGTNLSGLNDWSVERPMKNLFKNIRNEVISYSNTCNCWNANVNNEMTFDLQGYPTQLPQNTSIGATYVRYILSSDGGNLRMDSSYVLLYDGVGTIDMQGGVMLTSNAPGRIAFRVLNNGNIYFNLVFSNVNDHLRNIRLLRPQDEFANLATDPFYKNFKERIAPFKVLRFMDWGSTNGNTNVEWADRSKPDYFTYAGERGVPYELMIKLCNELKKDMWICVPHQASNDYITKMATLCRDSLHPSLHVYVEYSNEVWNWIFAQAHYNDQNRPSNLGYGRAMAEKARNVFDIWHNVWSGQECRVKRVLGIQVGFNSLNESILSQIPEDGWDYGSPTHYFGLDHGSTGNPRLDLLGSSATVSDVMMNALNAWMAFKEAVKQDYDNIKIFGKKIVTYEGGQHFVGNSFGIPYPYQQAMWDAQNSIEMYQMYDRMHDSIRAWGCELACNFSLATVQESVYGSWGVLRDIDDQPPFTTTARKYQAVLDNAASPLCQQNIIWQGNVNASWANPCNWNLSKVPNANQNVHILGPAVHNPEVDVNAAVKSLRLGINAYLTVLNGITFELKE